MSNVNRYIFNYVDQTEGICSVTISVAAGGQGIIITKNGYFIPLNSPEAEPLLAQWARLELGLS